MSYFDYYAFADYSGNTKPSHQQRKIAVSIISVDNTKSSMPELGYTRESLRTGFESFLEEKTRQNQRVIFGFDHSYSFPVGFYDLVTGTEWKDWTQLLDLLCKGTSELKPINDKPREWAKVMNKLICKKLDLYGGGPFWGPHFHTQMRKPNFPDFPSVSIKQKRLTEEREPRTKPIYKIGGNGSVGLQSLYGIQHLFKLRNNLKNKKIDLFCWPFDGWDIPSEGHVLVEIYPGLFNKGSKGDVQDAKACSKWFFEQDKSGTLIEKFHPDLDVTEKKTARLEGWIFGVR